jgi:Ca2+-binding EF-hand superfamily protein
VFLNLFIAIILDGYFRAKFEEDKILNQDSLDQYADAWALIDKNADGKIPKNRFKDLMFEIKAPLGWDESYIENEENQ